MPVYFIPCKPSVKQKRLTLGRCRFVLRGRTKAITKTLEGLARDISNNVYRVNSAQRKVLHLAAVFACNFTNHLYGIGQQLLAGSDMSFDMLRPLIAETADKIKEHQPADVQTGPAIRNDDLTMQAHLQMLNGQPGLQQIYTLLSQDIIKNQNTATGISNFVTFAKMNIFKVKINFEEKDHESVELPIAEGESVLDVCLENGIELQHNCGGVCGCSTCHIYVNKGMDNIQEISDKEEDFIDRAVNPRITSRLGCQCVIIDGDIEVTLPDQSGFMGH
jgi:2Fe-2S ferredoxin